MKQGSHLSLARPLIGLARTQQRSMCCLQKSHFGVQTGRGVYRNAPSNALELIAEAPMSRSSTSFKSLKNFVVETSMHSRTFVAETSRVFSLEKRLRSVVPTSLRKITRTAPTQGMYKGT